jgi:hypothetical protein
MAPHPVGDHKEPSIGEKAEGILIFDPDPTGVALHSAADRHELLLSATKGKTGHDFVYLPKGEYRALSSFVKGQTPLCSVA